MQKGAMRRCLPLQSAALRENFRLLLTYRYNRSGNVIWRSLHIHHELKSQMQLFE